MPVFQETAHASRDLRVRRSRARPLPRLSAQPEINRNNGQDDNEKYEVVVIGVRVNKFNSSMGLNISMSQNVYN
jgi:hypothetical protein